MAIYPKWTRWVLLAHSSNFTVQFVNVLEYTQTTQPPQFPYKTGNTIKQFLEKEIGKLKLLDDEGFIS